MSVLEASGEDIRELSPTWPAITTRVGQFFETKRSERFVVQNISLAIGESLGHRRHRYRIAGGVGQREFRNDPVFQRAAGQMRGAAVDPVFRV